MRAAAAAATTRSESDGSVVAVANAVIAYAFKQHTRDDTTALVARLWPAGDWQLRCPTTTLDDGLMAAFVAPGP